MIARSGRFVASVTLVIVTGCASAPAQLVTTRTIATPIPTVPAEAPVSPSPEVTASAKAPAVTLPPVVVTPTPVPTPRPNPRAAALPPFRHLGSWIDVYDHTDDPASVLPLVRGMAGKGVKTLYLETSRYAATADIQYPAAVGAALDEAKARKMNVVAWYPPAFDDLGRDVRRSLAAIRFRSPKGNAFDAFAADIEYGSKVPDAEARSKAAIEYSRRVRAGAVGFPMAAITIAPSSLEVRPDRWPDFPWKSLAQYYGVFMPMNYWTGRSKDPATAKKLTEYNTAECKRRTGRAVHIVGGIGADADEAQVAAYVDAAKRSGSLGGSLYDYRTTRPEVWDELRGFNQ